MIHFLPSFLFHNSCDFTIPKYYLKLLYILSSAAEVWFTSQCRIWMELYFPSEANNQKSEMFDFPSIYIIFYVYYFMWAKKHKIKHTGFPVMMIGLKGKTQPHYNSRSASKLYFCARWQNRGWWGLVLRYYLTTSILYLSLRGREWETNRSPLAIIITNRYY